MSRHLCICLYGCENDMSEEYIIKHDHYSFYLTYTNGKVCAIPWGARRVGATHLVTC